MASDGCPSTEEDGRLKAFLLHLRTECSILDRMVYKNRNQHRRCHYFQSLLKVTMWLIPLSLKVTFGACWWISFCVNLIFRWGEMFNFYCLLGWKKFWPLHPKSSMGGTRLRGFISLRGIMGLFLSVDLNFEYPNIHNGWFLTMMKALLFFPAGLSVVVVSLVVRIFMWNCCLLYRTLMLLFYQLEKIDIDHCSSALTRSLIMHNFYSFVSPDSKTKLWKEHIISMSDCWGLLACYPRYCLALGFVYWFLRYFLFTLFFPRFSLTKFTYT